MRRPRRSLFRKTVKRLDQPVEDTGLVVRVPGIVDQVKFRLRPGSMQLESGFCRGTDVVAALHDHPGNPSEFARILEKLARSEESAVDEKWFSIRAKANAYSGSA